MGDVDRQRENHEKRRQWIAVLRKDRARRRAGEKTTINFDAHFVGKSGGPGYAAPWQPVRLFAADGPVAKPVSPVVGFGRLMVDADELLAWFEKQEAKTYPTRCAR